MTPAKPYSIAFNDKHWENIGVINATKLNIDFSKWITATEAAGQALGQMSEKFQTIGSSVTPPTAWSFGLSVALCQVPQWCGPSGKVIDPHTGEVVTLTCELQFDHGFGEGKKKHRATLSGGEIVEW